jgi:hypothetical protein
MAQEVIALKLTSGEEIVARVEDRRDESLTLDRVMIVGVGPGKDGNPVVQMMPWLAANQDATVIVYNSHVVAAFGLHPELEKSYLQQTSRIQL